MTSPAWEIALDRFRGGYGGEPFLDEPTDRQLFLELLEYEIRAQIEADIAKFFYAEAEKIKAETRLLFPEASRGTDP